MTINLVRRLFRRRLADFRLGSSAETHRQMRPKLDAAVCARVLQGLGIGVRHHEFNALQIERNHRVNGIRATAADTDDGDPGREVDVSLRREG